MAEPIVARSFGEFNWLGSRSICVQSNWLFLVTSSHLMQRSLELKQKGRRKPLAGRTQVLECRLKKGWAVAPKMDRVHATGLSNVTKIHPKRPKCKVLERGFRRF